MGVRGLMKFINMHSKNGVKEKQLYDYSGTAIAIDMSLMIYSYVIAIRSQGVDLVRSDGQITSHLYGTICKIESMLKRGIIPIPVFDGIPPKIKYKTLRDRQEKKYQAGLKLSLDYEISDSDRLKYFKESYKLTREQIFDIKYLTKLLGLPFVQAPGEADSQCAALNITNLVIGTLSEDTDILVFGGNTMLKKINKSIIEVNLKDILLDIGLSHDQFIDLCIIMGSDYNEPIKGLSYDNIHILYKEQQNMESFIQFIENENKIFIQNNKKPKYTIPIDFYDNWKNVKEYYTKAQIVDPRDMSIIWEKPNKQKLLDFLCHENEFNHDNIEKKIDYIIQKKY
jgi:flap endonuclease-1